jgi:1-deoxy-D-xylulose-5-phosphate synthase
VSPAEKLQPLPHHVGVFLKEGKDVMVVAAGSLVHPALEAARELAADDLMDVGIFNARWIKPLPENQLLDIARGYRKILLAEENVLAGGFGSAVLELFADHDLMTGKTIRRVGLPDAFVEHGPQKWLRAKLGLDTAGIRKTLEAMSAPGQGENP